MEGDTSMEALASGEQLDGELVRTGIERGRSTTSRGGARGGAGALGG
jgi:hypothetical protein